MRYYTPNLRLINKITPSARLKMLLKLDHTGIIKELRLAREDQSTNTNEIIPTTWRPNCTPRKVPFRRRDGTGRQRMAGRDVRLNLTGRDEIFCFGKIHGTGRRFRRDGTVWDKHASANTQGWDFVVMYISKAINAKKEWGRVMYSAKMHSF